LTGSAVDLAACDHFHLRGRDATLELLRLSGLRAGERVLDVGGGIGGPARTLAEEGCSVTVLDLTEEFCRTGAALTERVGLADRVTFRHASALAMPFEKGAFDAVWTQHSSMNVEDESSCTPRSRAWCHPRGLLAMHEIMAGPRSAALPGAVGSVQTSASWRAGCGASRRAASRSVWQAARPPRLPGSASGSRRRAVATATRLHLLLGAAAGRCSATSPATSSAGSPSSVFDRD
jgi:SAM-dependent methyltransferase